MSEETVYNADEGPKTIHLRCNWCAGEFDYTEAAGRYTNKINCSWCGEMIHVPRDRMRRLNGHNRGITRR